MPDKECHTSYEKVCRTDIKITYAEECKPVEKKVCKPYPAYHHPYAASHYAYGRPYGHRWRREAEAEAEAKADAWYGGHHGYGYHGYAPAGPACKIISDKVCHKVPVKTPVPHCDKVPKTHCVDTLRPVHHTECHEVAVPSCHQVPRKVPVETPHQKCVSVPHEHCQDYPEKVARKVCHTPPPKLPKKRYGWGFLSDFWK